MAIEIQALGNGVCRIHLRNVGYADVAAIYSTSAQGWDVEVQQTNVANQRDLDAMVEAFREMEGLR